MAESSSPTADSNTVPTENLSVPIIEDHSQIGRGNRHTKQNDATCGGVALNDDVETVERACHSGESRSPFHCTEVTM
jgi:hypothetical protein